MFIIFLSIIPLYMWWYIRIRELSWHWRENSLACSCLFSSLSWCCLCSSFSRLFKLHNSYDQVAVHILMCMIIYWYWHVSVGHSLLINSRFRLFPIFQTRSLQLLYLYVTFCTSLPLTWVSTMLILSNFAMNVSHSLCCSAAIAQVFDVWLSNNRWCIKTTNRNSDPTTRSCQSNYYFHIITRWRWPIQCITFPHSHPPYDLVIMWVNHV
jgi:hypothetical protein